jgi:hypothetical protein
MPCLTCLLRFFAPCHSNRIMRNYIVVHTRDLVKRFRGAQLIWAGCLFPGHRAQLEVRVTPGEIKTKTPRIPRIPRIC